MKNFVIAIAMILGFSNIIAQSYYPLVTTGKVWSTRHIYCKGWPDTLSSYIKFTYDTTIDGHVYKAVMQTPNSDSSIWSRYDWIREDSLKRVYTHAWPSGEKLLYDFGVLPGDTIDLGYLYPHLYVVDSINFTTLLDGSQRHQFYMRYFDYMCTEIWIEGVGCLRGVMDAGMCGAVGDNPTLMCFIEHDTVKYHNPDFEECSLNTGIPELQNDRSVIIFPNPAKDQVIIRINKPLPDNTLLEIYDLPGRKVLQQPLSQKETILDLRSANLFAGTYIYKIFTNSGLQRIGKLLVQ